MYQQVREQQMGNTTTSHCGQCKLYVENEEHVIRCRPHSHETISAQQMAERSNNISFKESYAESNKRCNMSRVLHMARIRTQYSRHTSTTNKAIMKSYELQSTLGWNRFARGRMVIEWGHLIHEHLSKRRDYFFNSEHWGAKLLAINWNYILE
jgi:hypothetical protein